MKIIIVTHLFPNSFDKTYGVFFLEKAKALKEVGIDIKVIVPKPYIPKILSIIKPSWKKYTDIESYSRINEIDIFYLPYIKLPWRWYLDFEGLLMYFGIKKFLRKFRSKFKYQAVLGGMLTNDGYAALKVGKNDKIPAFSYIIGSDINVYPKLSNSLNRLTHKLLNKLDGIISVGNEFTKITEEKFPDLNKKIINNSMGLDLNIFCPLGKDGISYFRDKYSINEEDIVLFYVGHIIEQKGIKTLMNAVALIKNEPIKLFIAGSGNLSDWVDKFIYKNGLENICFRLGNIEYRDLPKMYRGADIFVFPSFREGSPTVLIEAAASGLPIIASDIPQNRDVLCNGRNGLEFEVDNENDLAKKIINLLDDSQLRKSFSKESRLIAQTKYDRIENANSLKIMLKKKVSINN